MAEPMPGEGRELYGADRPRSDIPQLIYGLLAMSLALGIVGAIVAIVTFLT